MMGKKQAKDILPDDNSYGAFTIDTNVFDSAGRSLEHKIMRLVANIKSVPVDFIVSDIVRREMIKHFAERIKNEKNKVPKLTSSDVAKLVLSVDEMQQLETLCKKVETADINATERIDEYFYNICEASVIPVNEVSIEKLTEDYFSIVPPFADSKKKKAEFPDAIALNSIEAWAQQNNKKVLAVSEDGDWRRFAEQSGWIDVVKSVPEALDSLADNLASLKEQVEKFIHDIDAGEHESINQQIIEGLKDHNWEAEVIIEGDSGFSYSQGDTEITYRGHSLLNEDGNTKFFIYSAQTDHLDILVTLFVNISVYVEYGFYVPNEEEDIAIGECSVQENFKIEVSYFMSVNELESNPSIENTMIYSNDVVHVGDILPEFDDDSWLD